MTLELPQLAGAPFITDGGMETTLIFHGGFELPEFAAFVLLEDETGIAALRDYYAPYVAIGRERGIGVALDTPTWRANGDWGAKLGYSSAALADVNRRAVALLQDVRDEAGDVRILISGAIGPRGDGYVVDRVMAADEAENYHAPQVETFAEAGADFIAAITLTYANEATGVVRAAAAAGIAAVISFTVETDGRLPSGQPLGDAIEEVDAATAGSAAYFMVNCAHPSHFAGALDGRWVERIRGVRANASRMSHAELDAAEELDEGDPVELAREYEALRSRLPNLNVVGGCCGTDHRHVDEMGEILVGGGR